MKKYVLYTLLLLAVSLLTGTVAQAQVAHHNDLSWPSSTTLGVQGYKVYKAPCTGTITGSTCSAAGTFSLLATLSTVNTYSDTTVVSGNKFDYYVTAFCPVGGCSASVAGESVPSQHWAAVTPSDLPNAPGALNGSAN